MASSRRRSICITGMLLCLNSHYVVVFITCMHSLDDFTLAARFLEILILLCIALLARDQILRLHLLRVVYCGCFSSWFTTRILYCVANEGRSTIYQVIWRFSEFVSVLQESCCYCPLILTFSISQSYQNQR
jgi:hypothetical protein